MADPPQESLRLNHMQLLIFVDDTGHEGLLGDQRYYGLGGAMFSAWQYEKIYKASWRELRCIIKGSPDAPLHASEFGSDAPKQAFDELEKFFALPFTRFAITTEAASDALPANMIPMQSVAILLKKYLDELSQSFVYSDAALIVESSMRADPLIKEHLSGLFLTKKGHQYEADPYLLPKKANEPGLEIADFIANAAGTQARFHLVGRKKFPLDFQQVFHQVPISIARYRHIQKVQGPLE